MMDRLQAARALAREHKDRGDDCGRLARVVLDVLPETAAPERPWFLPNAKRLRELAGTLNNIMPAFDSSQPALDEAARILRALADDAPKT